MGQSLALLCFAETERERERDRERELSYGSFM